MVALICLACNILTTCVEVVKNRCCMRQYICQCSARVVSNDPGWLQSICSVCTCRSAANIGSANLYNPRSGNVSLAGCSQRGPMRIARCCFALEALYAAHVTCQLAGVDQVGPLTDWAHKLYKSGRCRTEIRHRAYISV